MGFATRVPTYARQFALPRETKFQPVEALRLAQMDISVINRIIECKLTCVFDSWAPLYWLECSYYLERVKRILMLGRKRVLNEFVKLRISTWWSLVMGLKNPAVNLIINSNDVVSSEFANHFPLIASLRQRWVMIDTGKCRRTRIHVLMPLPQITLSLLGQESTLCVRKMSDRTETHNHYKLADGLLDGGILIQSFITHLAPEERMIIIIDGNLRNLVNGIQIDQFFNNQILWHFKYIIDCETIVNADEILHAIVKGDEKLIIRNIIEK